MFDLRKIFDFRKIFAVPKDFLKSKIYCTKIESINSALLENGIFASYLNDFVDREPNE